MNDGPQTHFGHRQVSEEEKTRLVGGVFSSVADRYDLMNDLMSGGIHRAWKKFAVARAQVQPGQRVLDVAGGSGDLTRAFSRQVGDEGRVVLCDINSEMLHRGRDRMIDRGVIGNIDFAQANAENLPFAPNSFHCVSISFGLRNVTRIDRALESMCALLKPGGRLIVLEFSRPTSEGLEKLYDFYSFAVVPKLGRWVADDEASYQYLVESIRRHPDQDTLRSMMLDAGFDDVVYHNLSGGIVALHVGFKY